MVAAMLRREGKTQEPTEPGANAERTRSERRAPAGRLVGPGPGLFCSCSFLFQYLSFVCFRAFPPFLWMDDQPNLKGVELFIHQPLHKECSRRLL